MKLIYSKKFYLLTSIAERCGAYPDMREERHPRLEFNTGAINILNSLEHMGYRVVTSGSFVASQSNNNKVGNVVFNILQPFKLSRKTSKDLFKKSLFGWYIANPMRYNKQTRSRPQP